MKKTLLVIGLSIITMAGIISCGDKSDDKQSYSDKEKSGKPAPPAPASPQTVVIPPMPKDSMPSYRFINFDSIMEHYLLARDFKEGAMRMQSEFESQYQNYMNQSANMQKKAEEMYSTRDEDKALKLRSELEAFNKTAPATEQSLMEKSAKLEKQMNDNLITIMDSVQNYLRIFAPANGYSAVFFGGQSPQYTINNFSAPYFHPDLDVTREVIEGLNARYNNVGN